MRIFYPRKSKVIILRLKNAKLLKYSIDNNIDNAIETLITDANEGKTTLNR